MLVSLSSYSQYPTVKTIGKDTVVIMTVKQGEDINQRFILNYKLFALITILANSSNSYVFISDHLIVVFEKIKLIGID